MHFPFPDQLPDESDAPETRPAKTDEPPVVTAAEASMNSDMARKSWADTITPLLGKPPHRAASAGTKLEYELMLQQVYKRMSRLMRADLDEPGVGP